MMPRADVASLPEPAARALHRVTALLFEAFDETMKGRLSEQYRAGRILALILHGSHAEPSRANVAPDEPLRILAIVNYPRLARSEQDWRHVRDRLHRASEFGEIAHPVRLTVASLESVNRALTNGVPYFLTVADEGIALYWMEGLRLETPRHLPAPERRTRGLAEYARWQRRADEFLAGAHFYRERGNAAMAALMLLRRASIIINASCGRLPCTARARTRWTSYARRRKGWTRDCAPHGRKKPHSSAAPSAAFAVPMSRRAMGSATGSATRN